MTLMWFAVAIFGLVDGWLSDNAALIILGFGCALVGTFTLAITHAPMRDEDEEMDAHFPIHRRHPL